MDHQGALEEMSVERYLLGELNGSARDLFEEHLFGCAECNADLKAGVQMLEGIRSAPAALTVAKAVRERSSWLRWLNPVWLAPALAVCLLTIVYQSAVVLPRMQAELARAETPAVLNSLSLTGVTRGGDEPKVVAPLGGSFLLSIDLPPVPGVSSYDCSLSSTGGMLLWHVVISPEQAQDAVQIRVPVSAATSGENVLKVSGIKDGSVTELSTHKFLLEVR